MAFTHDDTVVATSGGLVGHAPVTQAREKSLSIGIDQPQPPRTYPCRTHFPSLFLRPPALPPVGTPSLRPQPPREPRLRQYRQAMAQPDGSGCSGRSSMASLESLTKTCGSSLSMLTVSRSRQSPVASTSPSARYDVVPVPSATVSVLARRSRSSRGPPGAASSDSLDPPSKELHRRPGRRSPRPVLRCGQP